MPKKLYIYAYRNNHRDVVLTTMEPDLNVSHVRVHVSRGFLTLFKRIKGNYEGTTFSVLSLGSMPDTDEKKRVEVALRELL